MSLTVTRSSATGAPLFHATITYNEVTVALSGAFALPYAMSLVTAAVRAGHPHSDRRGSSGTTGSTLTATYRLAGSPDREQLAYHLERAASRIATTFGAEA